METPATEEIARTCAFCLTAISPEAVRVCERCKRRAYCSKKCQKADWSTGTSGQVHKIWCELQCGEEDLDWEVTAVPGKGMGLVAKRLFPAKSRIMVDAVRPKDHPGVQALMPVNGTTREKYVLNRLSDGEGGNVMCLRIARANHNCDENAGHFYDETFKVKILFALRDIQLGEEICINYQPIRDCSVARSGTAARMALQTKWEITCPENCACRNKEMEQLVEKGRTLDASIIAKARAGYGIAALKDVDKLLELHEAMKSSSISVSRTLNDGYQIAMMNEKLDKALDYAQRCFDLYSNTLQSPKSETTKYYKEIIHELTWNTNRK